MVKKDTIGKVQVGIGIIILVMALVGFYMSTKIYYESGYYSEAYLRTWDSTFEENSILSNETKAILSSSSIGQYLIFASSILNLIVTVTLFSTIGFFLSLLFITQGLINMGEKKNIQLLRR